MITNDWEFFEDNVCRCYENKQHDCSICPLNSHSTGSMCTEFAHENRQRAFDLMEEWVQTHNKYNFGDIVRIAKLDDDKFTRHMLVQPDRYVGCIAIVKRAYSGNFWSGYHYGIVCDMPGWGLLGIHESKLELVEKYDMPQPKYKVGDIVSVADVDTINRYKYLVKSSHNINRYANGASRCAGQHAIVKAIHIGPNIITYDLTSVSMDNFSDGYDWPEQMLLPVEIKQEVR